MTAQRNRYVTKHGGTVGFRANFMDTGLYFMYVKPEKEPQIMPCYHHGLYNTREKIQYYRTLRDMGYAKYRKAWRKGWI